MRVGGKGSFVGLPKLCDKLKAKAVSIQWGTNVICHLYICVKNIRCGTCGVGKGKNQCSAKHNRRCARAGLNEGREAGELSWL